MQTEFDICPIKSYGQITYQRLGAVKISEMKIDDDDQN